MGLEVRPQPALRARAHLAAERDRAIEAPSSALILREDDHLLPAADAMLELLLRRGETPCVNSQKHGEAAE